jgi:Zn-finger nucleic acid-binding protein
MSEKQKFKCPKCHKETLYSFNTPEGIEIDLCDSCKGIWLDKGESATFTELADDIPNLEEALADAKDTDYVCPKCQGKFQQMKYIHEGDLIIDRCNKCFGIWLDANELWQLEDLAARVEDPSSRIMRAIKDMKAHGYIAIKDIKDEIHKKKE